MDNSITLNLEYEAAEALASALEVTLNYDEKRNFLLADEFNVLGELRNVLLSKVGSDK